jgi:hypothetical protein
MNLKINQEQRIPDTKNLRTNELITNPVENIVTPTILI